MTKSQRRNFGADVSFLEKYVETVELNNADGASIAVVPAWQGRTMTSSSRGEDGISYGWINYDLISSGRRDPQANLYGGEDRFWISPEGGQFSYFFDPGSPMLLANWRCPPLIDTVAFDVLHADEKSIAVRKDGVLRNYSNALFPMRLDRRVTLLDRAQVAGKLGVQLSSAIRVVGHESQNSVTNVGDSAWRGATGLPGVWILCMNKPSSTATIVVPFQKGPESERGNIVTSDYFGTLDESRLKVDPQRGLLFFLGDGRFRSKLGLSFARARPILGSWDNEIGALTIVQFNLPTTAPQGYTNNLWKIQDRPFDGDVINSYNDGPNESGGMLGPFYELETLSPALALAPGEGYNHIHSTFHFEGDRHEISKLSNSLLGIPVDEIESQFGKPQNS